MQAWTGGDSGLTLQCQELILCRLLRISVPHFFISTPRDASMIPLGPAWFMHIVELDRHLVAGPAATGTEDSVQLWLPYAYKEYK